MADSDCTDCGGTCDDQLESCAVDVSDLEPCSTCGKAGTGGSTITMDKQAGCPSAWWLGSGSLDGKEVWGSLSFDSSEGCYELLIFCYTAPAPPTFVMNPVTMWRGCKGGDEPVGGYTRNEGCNSITTLSVT